MLSDLGSIGRRVWDRVWVGGQVRILHHYGDASWTDVCGWPVGDGDQDLVFPWSVVSRSTKLQNVAFSNYLKNLGKVLCHIVWAGSQNHPPTGLTDRVQ